jgi:hypothetical protein
VTQLRYRRTSVRAVLETVTHDHRAAADAHDALWAVLWNRRYDDVDEPFWLPDAVYVGILVFARRFPDGPSLNAVDTGEALLVFRGLPEPPPIGSRVRVVPGERDRWRFADGGQPLGLGIDLRFDEQSAAGETRWVAALRSGVQNLGAALDGRREQLAARRAELGARSEPASLAEIWREEIAAISDRVMVETDYTADEHAALRRARAKGARYADEAERKILEARRKRFNDRGSEELVRFRDERWPEIRDAASVEIRKYAEYRGEVLKLEDQMQLIRSLNERAMKAYRMLERIEAAALSVRSCTFDVKRLREPGYAEELLRSIELLNAAVPVRAQNAATSFSAYRAPTAGPSVVPPRV